MDIETFYVLLIDNNVATYEQIQTLLQEIQTIQVNLEWMHSGCVIEEGRHQCSVKSDRIYDACLIDTQLVAQNRRFLNEQEFPVIWLTDTLETGIAALRAGATDYLLYSQLSAPLLERSLRLTIAHFRTETQTRTLNTQLQQQLREGTQELQQLQQKLHQSKQSEMQRWKSESRLNALVNSTSDGLLIVDQRGIVRFVNPAATQLFNRTQEQLTNHEFGIPMIVGDVAEIGIFRPGGELGIGEMSITETEWEGEAAYVVSLRDITQRRQAEEALRDSEERFRQLADNIEDAFWLFSPYTEELFYVSPAFEKIWGRSCESLYAAPHTWIDTVHPDDRDIVSCAITQQLQGESTSIEYRIMRPDGEIRWVSARAFPIKNERYEVYRIAGIAEDISDRKRTEQALRNSEANYRQLAESVSDVFFAMDKTWRYIYWNKGSENLTGIPATEALGKSIYELFPDIQGTEVEAMYQDVMNNQQPRTCINQYQIQDQELFFEINAYPAQEGVSVFVKNITNRKQTEEALRRSEERFRTIFENSSIGIAVVGPDTKLVQTNPFFQQLVGYSGEELARLDYTHITHPDDLPLEQALAQDCMAGIRDSYCLEKRYIRSDGEIIWGNLIISIVRDTDGRFQFAVGMVEDITQRKRVEAELQQYRDRLEDLVKQRTQELLMANQQLQQEISERQKAESAIHFQARLLDLVEHAVIATDLSGTIIYWNRYAERLYGWLATEAMGRNIVETVPSQTSQSQAAEIMSCLSRGESWSGEFWVQRRDGTSFPALVTDSPIHDDRHQLIGIVGISFDITERKQLEEVLRKANAELGITVEERTRDLKSAIERLQEEIVERKRTEVALQQAKEAAEAANRAKSEFLANMSHELRTPLNSILGFAQLMNHQPSLSPQQQKYLGLISRSGEHLLSLINDILSMSKIEAGKITLNETNFDLYRLLQTLEQMFQLKAVNKGLYLIVERTADAPQYVQADESKLRQILINLLENAIKFTESGGIVLRVSGASGQLSLSNGKHQGTTNNGELDFNVSLAMEEELRVRALSRDSLPNHQPQTVFFEVEDTGSGIATEELQHLFEPFVQTKTGKKSQSGTGLGLAITRRFVQMMGGTIGISSSLGRGTIVKFHLPLQLTDVVKIPLEQPKRRVISLVPNQPQYRILIVEDNLTNRQLLKELLEPLGFEIQEAENGLEGVALWESWKPHFIWMDMRMPVMDGYEATRQIRAREKQITVDKKWLNCSGSMSGNSATVIVALTASAFEEELDHFLQAGCDDCVIKPFREEVILEKMAQYLGVRYLYEQSKPTTVSQPVTSRPPLTSEALAVMPADWIVQLHQAASSLDPSLMNELIEQIPDYHQSLAIALTDLVDDFRFDRIMDLTQLATP